MINEEGNRVLAAPKRTVPKARSRDSVRWGYDDEPIEGKGKVVPVVFFN
jgi:hypothetical protein